MPPSRSAIRRSPRVCIDTLALAHGVRPEIRRTFLDQVLVFAKQSGTAVIWPVFVDGEFIPDLDPENLDSVCRRADFGKISAAGLGLASVQSRTGGLTTAACMIVAGAHDADVVVTGGLGGVHRGRREDQSADLHALAVYPIPLLCAGFKPFIDTAASVAVLESMMVPIWQLSDNGWPCLYANTSGIAFGDAVENLEEVAAAIIAQRRLRPDGAAGLCVLGVPGDAALPSGDVASACEAAIMQADIHRICGNALTPWLVKEMRRSLGAKLDLASEAALMNNIVAGIAAANMLTTAKA